MARFIAKGNVMENKDLINLFFQVLTIIGTMGTGFFAFYRFVSSKIDKKFQDQSDEIIKIRVETDSKVDRVYKRVDEKVKELVKDDIYQLELKYQKENLESRFNTLMEFLRLKFDGVDKEFREFGKTVDKLVKHDEINKGE